MAAHKRNRAINQVTSIIISLLTLQTQVTTAAPFRWYNAGDSGSSLHSKDERAAPSAIYYLGAHGNGYLNSSRIDITAQTVHQPTTTSAAGVATTNGAQSLTDVQSLSITFSTALPTSSTGPREAGFPPVFPHTNPSASAAAAGFTQFPGHGPPAQLQSSAFTSCINETWLTSAPLGPTLTSTTSTSTTTLGSSQGVSSQNVDSSTAPATEVATSSSSRSAVSSTSVGTQVYQTEAGSFFETSSGVLIFSGATPVTVQSMPISIPSVTSTPSISKSIPSSLQTSFISSVIPFPTTIISSTSATLSPVTTSSTTSAAPSLAPVAGNVFVAINSDALPAQIAARGDSPIGKVGIPASDTAPLGTNKFYANLMIQSQSQPVWTQPYQLSWAKGRGGLASWGMSITHVDADQYQFGPGNPPSYYVNPIGVQSVILTAAELGFSTVLTTSDHKGQSVNANFAPSANAASVMTLPLVQGMGFVTAMYTGATPQIETSVLFQTLSALTAVSATTWKTTAVLRDGTTWMIYITPAASTTSQGSNSTAPVFVLKSDTLLQGPANWRGLVQIAKLNATKDGQSYYDSSAGSYATEIVVSGSGASGSLTASGTAQASYTLSFTKAGDTSKTLVMFALPHHYPAFDANTAKGLSGVSLQSSTKGLAYLVQSDSWSMVEAVPASMGFAPWSPTHTNVTTLSSAAIPLISSAAAAELSEDIAGQTDLDSMYFSGKALAKFATIAYTAHDLADAAGIAGAGLVKLKAALATFIQNKQVHPLNYDSVWKGIVSSAGFSDPGADFGNTVYNDHHFHYGYFVYTAAVIAYLDPAWLNEGTNKAWVQALVKDYANSVEGDPNFPFSRNFDWYNGHSWAHGLTESGAGKDQESSSEDSFASYAIKMWGRVIGDANMEARGNIMLAIQRRSFQDYYHLEDDNTIEPANYIANKASGILFEGKIDHTTYFGTNIEYIEGIHMLPIAPNTGFTRTARFVQQEWDTYFSKGRANVVGGWRGILYANLAYVDPVTSWNFFANPDFDPQYLDGGASRTWYLALTAALGGVS